MGRVAHCRFICSQGSRSPYLKKKPILRVLYPFGFRNGMSDPSTSRFCASLNRTAGVLYCSEMAGPRSVFPTQSPVPESTFRRMFRDRLPVVKGDSKFNARFRQYNFVIP